MRDQAPLGILGGSFDPIHNGHLQLATAAKQQAGLAQVYFIPCKTVMYAPSINAKQHAASAEQRLAMLRLALQDHVDFQADDRELRRATPSYTVATLSSLRAEFPQQPLVLILGSDSFATLPSWHQHEQLFALAHLLIVPRPGVSRPETLPFSQWYQHRLVSDPSCFAQKPAGFLSFLPFEPINDASSSIRQSILQGSMPKDLLPAAVINYIEAHGLYA